MTLDEFARWHDAKNERAVVKPAPAPSLTEHTTTMPDQGPDVTRPS